MLDFVPKADEEFEILSQRGVLIFVKLLNALTKFPSFVFTVYPLVTPCRTFFPVIGLHPLSQKDGVKKSRPCNDHQDDIRRRTEGSRRTVVYFDGENGSFTRLFHICDNFDGQAWHGLTPRYGITVLVMVKRVTFRNGFSVAKGLATPVVSSIPPCQQHIPALRPRAITRGSDPRGMVPSGEVVAGWTSPSPSRSGARAW